MRKKIIASLALNSLIFIVTTGVVISYFFGSAILLYEHGYECFMYFTTDSNILAAIAAIVMAIYEIQILRGKRESVPKAAIVFKYVGTVAITLTFTVVFCFLMAIYGPDILLSKTALHMHFGAPLLAFISLLWLENTSKLPFSATLLGVAPMAVYGVVYFTQVVVLGVWEDFYAFNQDGGWFITIALMAPVSYALAFLMRAAYNGTFKLRK